MLCPYCGFNIPEASPKFCPKCGKTISIIDEEKTQYIPHTHNKPTPQVQPLQTQPPQSQPLQAQPLQTHQNFAPGVNNSYYPPAPQREAPEKKSKKGFIIIIVLIALILVAAGVIAVILIGENNKKDDETTVPATTEESTTEEITTEEITTVPAKAPMDTVAIAEYMKERTVTVHTDVGTGSGFYIDSEGTLVTCYHVIEGASEISVESATGEFFDVISVLGFDWNADVAVLKIDIEESFYFESAEEEAKTGAKVYALGSSLGDYHNSFSEGVVGSDSRIFCGIDCIQMTTAISPGNSGGPLVNEYGEILGINAFVRTDGDSINFAVKIKYAYELDKTMALSVDEYVEHCEAIYEDSYYFYDYTYGYFTPSFIKTYQDVTGEECIGSAYDYDSDYIAEGYDPEMGIFFYNYDEESFEKYIEYIEGTGFEKETENKNNNITNIVYVHEKSGLCFDIYLYNEEGEENMMLIEPFLP